MSARLGSLWHHITSPSLWGHGVFWSWNAIFLAFMALGFAPTLLPELLNAVRTQAVPATFLVSAAVLTLIPVAAVLLGWFAFRREPKKLLALGYGVEGPLMMLVAVRFFAVRELTPALVVLLGAALVGLATFLWQLLDRRIDERGTAAGLLRLVGLTVLLAMGVYAAAWLTFYLFPLTAASLQSLGELARNLPQILRELWQAILSFRLPDLSQIPWRMLPLMILGPILAAFTATLVLALPVALVVLYTRAWWRALAAMAARLGKAWSVVTGLGTALALVALVVLTTRQPQAQAFALVEAQPATSAEAEALLAHSDQIRRGLLNAYLAPYRYFSARGEVFHIYDIYRQPPLQFRESSARQAQALYERLVSPILYQPVRDRAGDNRALRAEPQEAAELYRAFFDQSILDAERPAVVRAVRSTWSVDDARANWLAVDDREVLLERQDVAVAAHGDWAEVTLHEVYRNQTSQRQEVVYYFSLPESAVVTGLWLGPSDDLAARFPFRVSPRGAAQTAYRREVRRNVDPALMEQIGPRQYRLRVFPVEPMVTEWAGTGEPGTVKPAPELHLWLTYRAMATPAGWPLPRLTDRRNVYWDDSTQRVLGSGPWPGAPEDWLPAHIAASGQTRATTHRADFGDSTSVAAVPADAGSQPTPDALRLAVVVDRSRSMAEHASEVAAALANLAAAPTVQADVFLTAPENHVEPPSVSPLAEVAPADILYYGGQDPAQLLRQFKALRADTEYDAILVLTDDGAYDWAPSDTAPLPPDSPLWLIHLGGRYPLGYDDATLAAIQASGGGVAESIEEALARIAVRLTAADSGMWRDVLDGYVWEVGPRAALTPRDSAERTTSAPTADDDVGFAALAARSVVLAGQEREQEHLEDPAVLDGLHAIAQEHEIVTPFSSMIVLVNEAQQDRLDKLEQGDDRFQREYEAVGETEAPGALTAVPEPDEWLLLLLAGALVGWQILARRR